VNDLKPDLRNRRFAFFILVTAVFVLLLVWKFFDVMILNPITGNQGPFTAPAVERGPILDRNGRILAVQTRLYAVTAWMPNVTNPEKSAILLSDLLGLDAESISRRMRERSGFLYIKRKVSQSESAAIRSMINSGELPGISLEPEYGRNYPERGLASHVIGFVGTDNIGLDGIELTYDNVLSPPVSDFSNSGTLYGNQLVLTLDVAIQYFADKAAEDAWNQYDPDSVMIMIMDAKNGDFLAWSSWPGYDPNNFTAASSLEKQNLPVVAAYEPGSVFKAFTIASFMDLGGINPASSFYCDGTYEMSFPNSSENIVINCLGVHGTVHAEEILKYSCNSGAASASETVTRQDFYDKLTEFGFGSPTHLPFPGETTGILRKPSDWSGRTKPTIAIGQEVSVSAVQIVAAATAFANDGMVLEPHIVKRIVSPEGKTMESFDRRPVRQAISPETAKASLLMLESVTEPGGTGTRAAIEGTRVSIKTGTGEIYDPATGTYSAGAVLASALAVFPTEDPRFIIYVVIDHPRGREYYGGRIAAPIVGNLGRELIRYYGMPSPGSSSVVHDGTITVKEPQDASIGTSMPDLTGYSKRQLMPLLEQEVVEVTIQGTGWVVRQTPSPGTPIDARSIIVLELE
jgi:cell division protein FtsI (penicillin-binding protein 3)